MSFNNIDRTLFKEFLQALMSLPSADSKSGRDALLSGLPTNVKSSLNRSENPHVDFSNLLDQLQRLGRLTQTGERPLIIMAENASMQSAGTDIGGKFDKIISDLEKHYGGDAPPSEDLPEVPEKLIFEGRDERLPSHFFEQALKTGKSVARLMVPMIVNGETKGESFGTGWLIAKDLMITNFHVAGCFSNETISDPDLKAQAENAIAWFDYHHEGGARIEVRCLGLEAGNPELDYALLRLETTDALNGRSPIPIRIKDKSIADGARLNIVQYPGGGPLRFAVRNNFYVGKGDKPYQLRYLTDTEHGSSGSPVTDDAWQVVGLHHAYRQIPKSEYKGEIIRYHNQGIDIQAILGDLTEFLRKEINVG